MKKIGDADCKVISQKGAQNDGTIIFDQVSYSDLGFYDPSNAKIYAYKYVYYIREEIPEEAEADVYNGIWYDTHIEKITVMVSQDPETVVLKIDSDSDDNLQVFSNFVL